MPYIDIAHSWEIIVQILVILAIAYASYQKGRADAFKDWSIVLDPLLDALKEERIRLIEAERRITENGVLDNNRRS